MVHKGEENIVLICILLLVAILFNISIKYYSLSKLFIALIIVLLILFLYLWNRHGFFQDKNYLKGSTIKIVLITLLVFFALSYMVGIIVGFSKTIYSHTLTGILKNILPLLILCIVIELNRYLLLKRNLSLCLKVMMTLAFIIIDTSIMAPSVSFETAEHIFLFLSLILFPIIARECLYTYLTDKVSFLPTIIYRLCYELYIFIVPFTPNFGNYINSVMGIMMPYITYYQVKKEISYLEKYSLYSKKFFKRVIGFITFALVIMLVVLISGFFPYQMIAIASDSMNPIYNRGDAIVLHKVSPNNIRLNDILVFRVNDTIITHRVIRIEKKNKERIYITKGDNNDSIDKFYITDSNVIGKVVGVAKYIGYPTIWLNE